MPENGEKYGQGVNTYSYWVSTDILGSWTELPLVTPQQVSGSKTFKYIFTGKLDAAVSKSISYVGQKKHLIDISNLYEFVLGTKICLFREKSFN